MYFRDTIAAIATPPGPGGIGVIRASGPDAVRLAAAVFRRGRPGDWQSHRLYRGRVLGADGGPLDDGLAVLMRSPRSYTGEDVLELHCHGSPVILQQALAALLHHGARAALPGEFTKRAFLNGRLDLAQAEAVAALVGARTPDAAGAAADQLFGRLSAHLGGLRQRLVRVKAALEARLDFAEEDLDLDDAGLADDLAAAAAAVDALLRTHARGRLLRHGLRVAIIGQPNAGKSSLLNALVGADRAIVTPRPGTTRDVIEESADIAGVPVVLSDTAGLRDAVDEVERFGVERSRAVAAASDVVLVVLDITAPLAPQRALLEASDGALAAINKIDLRSAWSAEDEAALGHDRELVRISATTPLGLDELRAALVRRAGGAWNDQLPTLTSTRQHAALRLVAASLAETRAALAAGHPPDVVAVDLQLGLDRLGAVTGAITSEDVLDAIFSEFCIGK